MTDPIESLRTAFVERCREDEARLVAARPGDDTIASIAHRLAGAAGSFGFPGLSAAAAVVDHAIRCGERPTAVQLEAMMRELRDASGGVKRRQGTGAPQP